MYHYYLALKVCGQYLNTEDLLVGSHLVWEVEGVQISREGIAVSENWGEGHNSEILPDGGIHEITYHVSPNATILVPVFPDLSRGEPLTKYYKSCLTSHYTAHLSKILIHVA